MNIRSFLFEKMNTLLVNLFGFGAYCFLKADRESECRSDTYFDNLEHYFDSLFMWRLHKNEKEIGGDVDTVRRIGQKIFDL